MEECSREIDRVDLLISTVKEKLSTPDASLPHRGPPENERNQGIYQYLQTSRFGEYPTHDEPAVRFQAPYGSAEERARAIQRDRDSQRAWWKAEPAVSGGEEGVGGESAGTGETSEQHLGQVLEVQIPLGCGVCRLPLRTYYYYPKQCWEMYLTRTAGALRRARRALAHAIVTMTMYL